jgi:hypothetical protein
MDGTMSKKDIITGQWTTKSFTRRGIGYVKSTLKGKGFDTITNTVRANSVLGNIENIRTTRSGHTKFDLFEKKRQTGTLTLHKKFDISDNYDDKLSGRFSINLDTEKGKFWEPTLANHWFFKISYIS